MEERLLKHVEHLIDIYPKQIVCKGDIVKA